VTGVAGHAGTVPMRLRNDALAGAAEMILLAEKIAGDFAEHGMVATVGRIEARPGAANIIPGVVRFTLDLRTASDTARNRAIERFEAEAHAIAERRKSRLCHRSDPQHRHDAGRSRNSGSARRAAVAAVGTKPLKLASGAGHDGLMMAKLCPMGMLFVRCKAGVSHNPAEYASPDDMGLAVAALARFIQQFKPVSPGKG
jgi:allantoate deiminase